MKDVGLVAIGRNEGERLRRCLASAAGRGPALVYVDSGSSDGSVETARGLGAEVVDLDLSIPFTAARARNAGLNRLLEIAPEVRYVQFIDGDCELADGWLDRARRELEERPDAGAVGGRCRERLPDETIYNRLADLEWDTPVGEAKSCGGNSMMRVAAVRAVGGFDPALIAGEEPELCVRLRREGWTIHRLDAEMVLHDMAMTRFGQWWKRAARAGHAFAEGAALHGAPPERHFVRETRSIIALGLVAPIVALALAWPTRGLSVLALLGAYLLLAVKVYRHYRRRRGWSAAHARLSTFFVILSKFAGAQGVLRYWLGRISGKRSRVVDFRGPATADEAGARAGS